MDNPPFPEMHRISLGYVSATVAAAKQVAQGAPLAFAIGGGLHHAMADRASGFCIYNDPAIACSILRESFDRVAYVDIDVHHGDGVQAIWLDDPNVLTASIHEDGRTLFPGTGGVHEVGASFSSVNVPVAAKTSYDVWLEAFRGGILPALMVFEPQAIVLQLGTDIHFADPLGHILGTQDVWLEAVREVMRLGVPIVAVGGGGYNLDTVPRMWVSACLELAGIAYSDELPEPMATEWQARTFSDQERPVAGNGREQAKQVLMAIERDVLPYVPRVS
jgi:acetoin utilization protein AcuC